MAVGFLDQVVLRIAVVSAPAVAEQCGVQSWSDNFLSGAGNVGQDVQGYIVIAQAVREALFEDVCAVQRNLVGTGDVVVDLDREGNASSGQFLNCLLFVLLTSSV